LNVTNSSAEVPIGQKAPIIAASASHKSLPDLTAGGSAVTI
jgi:hypothetical protein